MKHACLTFTSGTAEETREFFASLSTSLSYQEREATVVAPTLQGSLSTIRSFFPFLSSLFPSPNLTSDTQASTLTTTVP